METVGDELLWWLNAHLVAALTNKDLWSRPRTPQEAEHCLWRRKPTDAELHEVARRKGWRVRVVEKLTAIFPGLK